MTHKLKITAHATDGVLQRILGLAGRRCFEPVGIQATLCCEYFEILLTVKSDRAVRLLATQLERLYDVNEVIVVDKADDIKVLRQAFNE